MATWGPDNLEERLAVAAEVVRLAEAGGDRVTALKGRGFLLADQLEQGDLPALERGLEGYGREAQALGQLHFSWHVPLFRAGQELLGGRLEEAERLAGEALALGRRAHDLVVAIYHTIVLVGLRWEQGRLPELETPLRRFVDRFPANLGWRATLAVLLCEAGRHDEAREHVERLAADEFAGLPRNHLYLYHLAVLAIACAALGDRGRAARLYELLLPMPAGTSWWPGCRSAPSARPTSTWACWPRPCPAGTTRRPTSRPPCRPTSAWARPRWWPAAVPASPRPSGPGGRPGLGQVLLGDPGHLAPVDGDPERVGVAGREVAGQLVQGERDVLGCAAAGLGRQGGFAVMGASAATGRVRSLELRLRM
jgi:hypothetical protein